nr:hypothetical protein [Tanacetum cinerariifolium]
MAESSSHKSPSPKIKEEPVTLDIPERPNPFLPATQVDFTFDEISFTTNNEVALIYPSHPNQEYFIAVSDFISKCCLKEAFTRALNQYKEYLSEFWVQVNYAKIIWDDLIHKLIKKTREKIIPYPSLAKDKSLSHLLPPTPMVGEMHKEAQQAADDVSEEEENAKNDKDIEDTLKKELEQAKVTAEVEVASMKVKPSYPDINQLTELLVTELKNIQWELPAEFLDLPHLASSVQEKLKSLDSLPDVPSVGKVTASPAEGEKNTKDADTNLKNELVDLLGIDVVTQYYNKKIRCVEQPESKYQVDVTGFLGGTILVEVNLVKGHLVPTIMKVLPVDGTSWSIVVEEEVLVVSAGKGAAARIKGDTTLDEGCSIH